MRIAATAAAPAPTTTTIPSRDAATAVPIEGTYHFSGAPLAALAAVTMVATEFRVPYSNKMSATKSLWLVKDAGLYIMNACPNPRGRARPLVAVCQEGDALEPGAVFGGDDFVSSLPIDGELLTLLAAGRCGLGVTIGEESIDLCRVG